MALAFFIRVMEFSFFECTNLPIELVETTVNALVLVVKKNNYMATISTESSVNMIGTIISCLLDSRLDKGPREKLLAKSINKVQIYHDYICINDCQCTHDFLLLFSLRSASQQLLLWSHLYRHYFHSNELPSL
jgi:hypothetical protein